jgi:hypothetical protein
MDDLYDGGASVYNQAKDEYTKQLVLYLTPAIFTFFMKVFKQALEDSTISGRSPLVRFQEFIRAVPEWNIDKVVRETASVIGDSKCDYLEELLSAVFIAHTKVLTAIRPNSGKNMKVQIVVPKLDHYVHRALSDCSRILYKWTYLFQHDLSPIEKQKNYRAIEIQISEGILQAIRGLLPVKNILKDCLAKDAEEPEVDGDDSDSDDEIVPMVKKAGDNSGDNSGEKPEPTPVAAVTETKTVAAPPQDVAVEKLEEVAHIDATNGTVDVPAGSIADMSGNDKVFTGKESKEIAVEKVDSAAIIENIPIVPTIKVSKEEDEEGEKKEEKVDEGTPSVSFSDYDQVYTPFTSGGGKTSLTYAPKTEDDDFEVDIIGDATSELSDVEDLDFAPVAVGGLTEDDYEVL